MKKSTANRPWGRVLNWVDPSPVRLSGFGVRLGHEDLVAAFDQVHQVLGLGHGRGGPHGPVDIDRAFGDADAVTDIAVEPAYKEN